MGLYSGGLIIGRIFASEIWGAYFREGLFIYLFIYLFILFGFVLFCFVLSCFVLFYFILIIFYLFIYLFFFFLGGGGAYYANFTICH